MDPTQSTRPPQLRDDETEGYSAGSVWIQQGHDGKTVFVCYGSEKGNAVWLNMDVVIRIKFRTENTIHPAFGRRTDEELKGVVFAIKEAGRSCGHPETAALLVELGRFSQAAYEMISDPEQDKGGHQSPPDKGGTYLAWIEGRPAHWKIARFMIHRSGEMRWNCQEPVKNWEQLPEPPKGGAR